MNNILKLLQRKTFLSWIYLTLCGAILINMNVLITDKPVVSDAEQNLTMAYHLYKNGVLSNDRPDSNQPAPSNYREPVPPVISALGMYLHPGIDQNTSFQSIQHGQHTKMIKQVNLFWILLLLIGMGYLTYILSKNKYLPFLSFLLAVVYFIRFGNHFDNLHTELAAATLMIWLSIFLVLMVKKKTKVLYFSGGVVLSLLILTKGVFLYLSLVILLFILIHDYRKGEYIKLALFTFGTILLVAPWLVRNYGIYQEFSLTQRGGAVLHLRAMHNQMNEDEVIGAINYWGPEIYRDIVRKSVLGAENSDFDVGGKYEKFNMDLEIDTLAVELGYPEMAISYFSKSRAEINRLQRILGSDTNEGPRHEAYKIMEKNSKEMILAQPVKHSLLSFVYLWRGIWCFPNSTIPFLSEKPQIYLHNIINFIAYFSLFMFFIAGIWKNKPEYIAFTLVPVSMLLIHALLTQNLARFSEPAIPHMLISLSLFIFLLRNKVDSKLST